MLFISCTKLIEIVYNENKFFFKLVCFELWNKNKVWESSFDFKLQNICHLKKLFFNILSNLETSRQISCNHDYLKVSSGGLACKSVSNE